MPNVAIIDADLIANTKHRFPNLCCMKISSYHKSIGDTTILKLDYDDLEQFDTVYISKVFTKTNIPNEPYILNLSNVKYGGTGFLYDKAPPLPHEIEHSMPDYHLYDDWVNNMISSGVSKRELQYYTDYSIGYLTRKCFRQCYYCVNRNYRGVELASPLSEFLDESRPKMCFLDDNFLGYGKWRELIESVKETGKRFQFKQGLDERLLTRDSIVEISKWKYDGDMIFAFDNIEDENLIVSKLKLIRETVPDWRTRLKFYVFCGCDKNDVYDDRFWHDDLFNLFKRIKILTDYGAYPYIMRFEKAYESKYSTLYATIATWCNYPSFLKTMSFRECCKQQGMRRSVQGLYKKDFERYINEVGFKGASWRALDSVEQEMPDISNMFFDFKVKLK